MYLKDCFKRAVRKRNSGMTLVEIMVSTVIFVVIVAVLYAGLLAANNTWFVYRGTIETQRQARLAITKMVKDIREATNIAISQNSTSASISFTKPGYGDVSYTWTNQGDNANKIYRQHGASSLVIIAQDITSLSFTNTGEAIIVALTASEVTGTGQSTSFSMSEKIALRQDS